MQTMTLTTPRGRVAALTALLLCTALVQAVPQPASAAATRYEAESATIVKGAAESNHSGYSGTGFVNGDNVVGSYVEFTVTAASAGTGTIAIRYSNGTADPRPADVAVGGTVVSAARAFNATTDWNTWATSTLTTPVKAGSNKIRLTSTTANGLPNLDYLDVTVTSSDTEAPTAPTSPSCSEITENSLTLNWGAATDNVGVAAYDIYEHGNKSGEAPGTATTKKLTGLTPGTTYNLTVFARDAAGNVSSVSPIVDCTTLRSSDTTAPSAPGTLSTSDLTANSVALSWGRRRTTRPSPPTRCAAAAPSTRP